MLEKRIGQNPGKSSSFVLVSHRNRSGVVELEQLQLVGLREPLMFAKVENGVTKSCHFFSPKEQEKRIFGLIFPTLFLAGSLMVRESRAVDIGVTKSPTKTAKEGENSIGV